MNTADDRKNLIYRRYDETNQGNIDIQQPVVGDDMTAVRGIQTDTYEGHFLGMIQPFGVSPPFGAAGG